MSSKLSNEEIARLIALAEAATPGPWTVGEIDDAATLRACPQIYDRSRPPEDPVDVVMPFGRAYSDAAFIAAAREAVPALCQALLTAREDLLRARALLGEAEDEIREAWSNVDSAYRRDKHESPDLLDRIRAELDEGKLLDASKADASKEGGHGG